MTSPEPSITVHKLTASTSVNGPGNRALLHVQGCAGMPCASACFNKPTHGKKGGRVVSVSDLTQEILAARSGKPLWVTISGGEPMQQKHLPALLRSLRAAGADSIICYTGYTLSARPPVLTEVWHNALVDVLVMGPYDPSQPHNKGLRSSANQELKLVTDRHSAAEFEEALGVELHYAANGSMTVTGFPSEGQLDTLLRANTKQERT